METQRLEEARMRKNAEIDRRMMQMRLAKTNLINEEKDKKRIDEFTNDVIKIKNSLFQNDNKEVFEKKLS